MADEWRDCLWGDITTLEYGKGLRGYENGTGPYPVYGTNGPIGKHVVPLCNHPGVIIGRKGAYRGVHYSKKPFFVIDTAFYLEPKADIDLRWAYYELLTHDINGLDSGSAIPSTSRDAFYNLPVRLPPSPEQHAIARILGTLDDKIELNRQMNKTLEAIAQALFKSWFVDFDPVRARMEGRQPYGMDAETAALFPDSFEDSPFGKIPRNWSVKPLSDCVSYLSRGVAPSYVQTSPIRALNQKAIRWWHIDDEALKFHNSAKLVRKEAYIRKGDVVINSTGDITIGRAYWFYHDIVNLFADSHVSIIRLLPDVLLPEVVVFQIETPRHQDLIYGHVTGSTGQLELNRSNLAHIPFLCPPIRLQWRFSEMVRPLFYLIWHDKEQSHILTTIRDTLLPKLLSGEMRVKDAEKFVEARAS